MSTRAPTPVSGKRVLLLAVAGFLSVTALLAIGILLFGGFGETEQRILGTTGLLAAYGLLGLPAAFLLDQRRLPTLAVASIALAAVGALLNVGALWTSDAPEELGKAIGTVTALALASAQVSALAAHRREHHPRSVRRLFVASSGLAAVVVVMLTVLLWAEIEREGYVRVLGALVVLDVLAVALQPILARARPVEAPRRLRILVAPDDAIELTVEAPDLATAAAKAIRLVERDGRRVLGLEVDDPDRGS